MIGIWPRALLPFDSAKFASIPKSTDRTQHRTLGAGIFGDSADVEVSKTSTLADDDGDESCLQSGDNGVGLWELEELSVAV